MSQAYSEEGCVALGSRAGEAFSVLLKTMELTGQDRTFSPAGPFTDRGVTHMKTSDFGRCLFSAGAMGVLAAGCAASQPPIGAPGTLPQSTTTSAQATEHHLTSSGYKVLASFDATSGTNSEGTLLAANGMLYGTTSGGYGSRATGTVFSITTSGALKVLYRFSGSPDGAVPRAGLVNVNGTFYGTTSSGGANEAGTVFSVTRTGEEKVLYSFGGGADGAFPERPCSTSTARCTARRSDSRTTEEQSSASPWKVRKPCCIGLLAIRTTMDCGHWRR